MIYKIIDGAFGVFLWMIIDPDGQLTLMTNFVAMFLFSAGYLVYDYWRGDEVEKPGRSGDTGSQRKSAKGEDKGAT